MEKLVVFTRQNYKVLIEIEENGRYISRKEYVRKKLDENADIYLNIYEWLTNYVSGVIEKPTDVELPIWVSLSNDEKLPLTDENVILEIGVPKDKMMLVDMLKWGQIANFSYIPTDLDDKKEHEKLLLDYNTNNQKAIMTNFYPEIQKKIKDSWNRLFDNNVKHFDSCGNEMEALNVGIIWEVKREWVIGYESLPLKEK